MNIQQLNGNGQHLWVFFTTVIIALIVTGSSWFSANRFAKGKTVAWYRDRPAAKRRNDEVEDEEEYGLLIRIAMLVWLLRNGLKAWMWHSGAWIAILVNSKARGRMSLNEGVPTSGQEWENIEEPACRYVSQHSNHKRFEEPYFRVESGKPNVIWFPLRYSYPFNSALAPTN